MTFTLAAFHGQLNTKFRVAVEHAADVVLDLVEATDLGSSPKQIQFSICFRGPLDCFLSQKTYTLNHDKLGKMELFLVPIGRESDGFRYEAVVNRFA